MVETTEKRDIVSEARFAYIGDDTGLIKKVRITAKRIEETKVIQYTKAAKQREKEEKKRTFVYTRPNTLGESDNQRAVKQVIDLTFKQTAKYGEQKKDEGIQFLDWVSDD